MTYVYELDHIKPPFPTFIFGNERLGFAKARRDLLLGKISLPLAATRAFWKVSYLGFLGMEAIVNPIFEYPKTGCRRIGAYAPASIVSRVIGLGTSMRRMEILAIRRDNVNLEHRTIYIPKAKGGARRAAHYPAAGGISRRLYSGLTERKHWLFSSPGARKGHTMDIRKPFRRVVSAAGMNPGRSCAAHASPHRHHTFGSGWSGFTYGKEDFRAQNTDYGGTLCPPERRAYQYGDG